MNLVIDPAAGRTRLQIIELRGLVCVVHTGISMAVGRDNFYAQVHEIYMILYILAHVIIHGLPKLHITLFQFKHTYWSSPIWWILSPVDERKTSVLYTHISKTLNICLLYTSRCV